MSLHSELEGRLSSWSAWSDLDEDWRRGRPAPGKMATTQRLAGARRAEAAGGASMASGAVQAKASGRAGDGGADRDDPFAVHLIAQQGLTGGGGALPHLAAIQRSFGHHDVSGVRAHIGGAAAESSRQIGAKAYASGDSVAFAADPDLHLAAHEAAHVVQQRGGVRLAGGVGREGDGYEQHADAVADLVVRGESAQALLDGMAHRGSGGGPAVQGAALQLRYFTDPVVGREGRASEEDVPRLRGEMASATLEQLFAAYAMEAPADASSPVQIGGASVTYEWIRGRVGTVVLRGEIRAELWAGHAPASVPLEDIAGARVARRVRTERAARAAEDAAPPEAEAAAAPPVPEDRTAICDAYEATLTALRGDATRLAELRALVDELRADRPALLDEHNRIATFRPRRGRDEHNRAALAGHTHAASDISARTGTGVYAPLGGTVIFSGGHPGYGNLVRLLHPAPDAAHARRGLPDCPVETVYAHLTERLVEERESVAAGQAIGMVGNTRGDEDPDGDGRASASGVGPGMGAHLHFTVIPQPEAEPAGASEAEPTAAPSRRDREAHSTDREEAEAIRPDEWLAALGVQVSAAPILEMSGREARAARRTARGRGGTRDLGSDAEPAAAAADAPVARFAEDNDGKEAAPAGVAAPDAATERHAEAVAEAVVRGESAAALLDRGPSAASSAVHRGEEDEEAAPRVYGDDCAVTLPEGVTQRQVDAAIAWNDELQLRIDWVRRLQAHVRADGAMTSTAGEFDTDTVAGLMRLQAAEHRTVDGRITPAMRRFLEERFPDLHATLLGSHTAAADRHRVLVPGEAQLADRYGYYRSIITEAAGVFLDGPNQINLLGIRGVELAGAAPSLTVRQSGSATDYAAARAEDDAALADGSARGDRLHADHETPDHFDGDRPADAEGLRRGEGFDDLVVSLWYEQVGGERVYHVNERRGSVDPSGVWSRSEDNPRRDSEGTAHLRDGQYLYHLGRHGTSADAHVAAVRDAYEEDSAPLYPTLDRGEDEDDGRDDSIEYAALVPSRDLEVWRDRPGAADDDRYLTAAEEAESDSRVVAHRGRYTTRGIAINLHSSPDSGPSSVGCQTVPVGEGYDDLIGEVRGANNSDAVYYTLIDASRIEAGLVLEQSAPRQSAAQAPASETAGAVDSAPRRDAE